METSFQSSELALLIPWFWFWFWVLETLNDYCIPLPFFGIMRARLMHHELGRKHGSAGSECWRMDKYMRYIFNNE